MPRLRRANALLCILLGAGTAAANPPDRAFAQTLEAPTERELYLEVYINDRAAEFIARFVDVGGGILAADADELCNVGIRPLIDGRRGRGDIELDRIDGISYEVDEADQSIHITATDEACSPRVISAIPQTLPLRSDEIDTGFGGVLNYDLSVNVGHDAADGRVSTNVAGGFEGRLFSPVGTLTHGFSLPQEARDTPRYRRLDSYWRVPLHENATQLQMGDVTTRGPGWSRAVRLGGLLIERNFELQPDRITIALPSFEGTAALPSTVEVYSDSLLRFSTDVPAGPFELTDIPLSTGGGEAELILRDSTGRERHLTQSFLVSPDLMRPGTFDYAFALGRPRLGIGTDSDRYGETTYGMGTLRLGVNDRLTVAAHAEAGADLRMGGLGATFAVGHMGTASANLAYSRTDQGSGAMGEISGRLNFGRLRVSGRAMRQRGAFFDIARHSAVSPATEGTTAASVTALNQLSLSVPSQGAPGGGATSAFYADTWRADGERDMSIGLSHSRPLFERGSLNLSAAAVRGESRDLVLGVGVNLPLGERSRISSRIHRRDGKFGATLSAQGRPRDKRDGWNWRLQATRDAHARISARAGRHHSAGRLELAARASRNRQRATVRASGSVALAGGGVFFSERISDAFAVVDVGAPDVEVMFENRSVGRTGASGRLLVPGLRSYQRNRVSIDPAALPLDAHVPGTHEVVHPAQRSGTRVDFGIDTAPASALVGLVDTQGAAIDVGMPAVLSATGERFLVGYDGQVYLQGLEAENELVIHYPDRSSCRASFAYSPEPGTITRIEGVPCE